MRRVRNEKGGIAAALSEAQKLVFGPFIFQAVVAARRLGILKAFSESTDPDSSVSGSPCLLNQTREVRRWQCLRFRLLQKAFRTIRFPEAPSRSPA